MSRPEYNPLALVADVVRMLGAKGVTTLVGANATTAKHAAADLLRALGVVPASAPTSSSSPSAPSIPSSSSPSAPSIPSSSSGPSSPSSPEVGFGADRFARPDERCDCGRAAQVVYATTGYGDLAWCGQAHR